jgi:hypothetical protein
MAAQPLRKWGQSERHVVADAAGCGLCTWSLRGGRWALKFVNQACVLHRDDQVEHDLLPTCPAGTAALHLKSALVAEAER